MIFTGTGAGRCVLVAGALNGDRAVGEPKP
jgi:hypothetical protein